MRTKCIETVYLGRSDRSIDVLLVHPNEVVVYAYNDGNGCVKLFPSLDDLLAFRDGIDGYRCIDVSLDDYNNDEIFLELWQKVLT